MGPTKFWEDFLMKRFLAILLAMLLALAIIPALAIQASAGLSVQQLKDKFPAGKYWNHVGMAGNNPDGWTETSCGYPHNNNCNKFDGHTQCSGFAYKLAYDVYGEYARNWLKDNNTSNLKAGDILRINDDGHSIFITEINGDTITYADCNRTGGGVNPENACKIYWDTNREKGSINVTYVLHAPYALGSTPVTLIPSVNTNQIMQSILSLFQTAFYWLNQFLPTMLSFVNLFDRFLRSLL